MELKIRFPTAVWIGVQSGPDFYSVEAEIDGERRTAEYYVPPHDEFDYLLSIRSLVEQLQARGACEA
jgi:hypothetical protein